MHRPRRRFLRRTTQLAAWTAAALAAPALAAAQRAPGKRYVIVNADDFGASDGVNRGIVDAHERGIVTSTTLLVDAPAAEAAAALARRHPRLDLGLHARLARAREWLLDVPNVEAIRDDVERQLERFVKLTGRAPTHIDSHHHVHGLLNVADIFLDLGARYGVPIRGFSDVMFVGRFWGRGVNGERDPAHISTDYLISLLRSLRPGVSELSCHPGYADAQSDGDYNGEREVELRALTDPGVRAALGKAKIRLISYRDYLRLHGEPGCSPRL
jgi:predicted glycoside hydrolase/deacetylase ChbG (UPF0249 family)